jgi:multidrug efflux pump
VGPWSRPTRDCWQAPDVSKAVEPKLQSIKDALSYGYRIETGGSIEESVKANGALLAVFPVMAVVMLAILMIQLQSVSRLALVFVTAPLGLIGATGALLISNRPFGFVALLGLIALAGMIMRNTVILVDQIDRDIAAGHGRHRAIIGATVRRARLVILTALAAILGMIPLAGSVFWGPHGNHHHGRPVRCDRTDAARGTGAVRAMVPSAQRRDRRCTRVPSVSDGVL